MARADAHAPAPSPDLARGGITIRGLAVDYPTPQGVLRAVEAVDLDVAPGEFVAILGPSGCGKSTILRVLAGLQRPAAGDAGIGGAPVVGPRRDIGVVFQDPTLLPWKTVFQNVCLPGRIMGLPRGAYEARARELLALVGLTDFAGYYPGQLSGGMRQRVGIARGLLHDPAVLLMDEPFGALDAMTREQMNMEILRIWAATGKTVVFITHSISEAALLSDRIVVLSPRPGRVIEIMANALARPRAMEMMATPEFGRMTGHLRGLFHVAGTLE